MLTAPFRLVATNGSSMAHGTLRAVIRRAEFKRQALQIRAHRILGIAGIEEHLLGTILLFDLREITRQSFPRPRPRRCAASLR